ASEGDRQRHETSPLRDGSTTSLPGGSGSRVPPRGSLCGEDGKNAEKNAFPLAGIGPAGGCEAIHPRGIAAIAGELGNWWGSPNVHHSSAHPSRPASQPRSAHRARPRRRKRRKMIPDQRREHILKLLQERHVLSINELTSLLSVSHMTVRRDIQALENDGKVLSVTGGVRLAARLKSEPSYLAKAQLEVPAKRAISRAAAALVRENFTIFLDAVTTTLQMVPMLTDKAGL